VTPATACSSQARSSPTPSALLGNDLATFPDFPAEIRAPAGTTFGVSGFQLNFAEGRVHARRQPDVLVAMNPAALKVNSGRSSRRWPAHHQLDEFTSSNLERAGYAANPLETARCRATARW
jgi:2-oxoglutarate ferredoxin oxidoreductase subunit alpha